MFYKSFNSINTIMIDNELFQAKGTRDRYTASVMFDLRGEMNRKIGLLQTEQARLVTLLNEGYDDDAFRRLNIVNQHIDVAISRRKGEWLRGSQSENIVISGKK